METVDRIVTEIQRCVQMGGFAAIEDEARTRAYLNRHFPEEKLAVEACVAVLYLDRYMDALLWLYWEPQTHALRETYRHHYECMIHDGSFEIHLQPLMLRANALLLGS